MRFWKKIGWLLVVALCAAAIMFFVPEDVVYSDADGTTVKILFTHDIHDHFEAHAVTGSSKELGGYARLASAIAGERGENTVLVDAGDFSMGSVFQTVFEQGAPTLRVLGALGYDAVTLGNHEFDYGSDGLAAALLAASARESELPALLVANLADATTDTGTALSAAMRAYGARDCIIIERSGVKIGLFGIVGTNAMSSAYRSTSEFTDEVKAAKAAVKTLKAAGAELIVCLSHSGTSSVSVSSADENLAANVNGIDVIVSGHSHTVIPEPLYVNGTLIVSCGQYAENLGALTLVEDGSGWAVKSYELLAVDSTYSEDADTAGLVTSVLDEVDDEYMSYYGYELDDALAYTDYSFVTGLPYANNHYNEPLARFVCDAQKYAIARAEGGGEDVDVSIVFDAAIRGTIDSGTVTASEAYSVRGLGYGNDGYSGDPLVTFYLTGKELRYLCEADVSVADFSAAAQIYMSGITYTYNPNALFLARVQDVFIVKNGVETPIEKDKLYRVSTCLYNVSTFSAITSMSAGIIKIVPKDADGNPIEDGNSAVVYTSLDGKTVELKEWLAVAQYAESFPVEDGLPHVSSYYNGLFTQRTSVSTGAAAGYLAVVAVVLAVVAAIAIPVALSVKKRRKTTHCANKRVEKNFLQY